MPLIHTDDPANGVLVIGCDTSGNGGIDISHLAQYKVLYPKLWSSDSGRNMKGDNKATLVGIFTKLQVTLVPSGTAYNDIDIMSILNILNSANVYVKYYDIQTHVLRVESFYFGDIETELINALTNQVRIAQFSIIGNKRRTV